MIRRLLWCGLAVMNSICATSVWPTETKSTSVVREDDWKAPGQSGWVMAVCYAAPEGTDMVRGVSAAEVLMLRSGDNGKTWGGPGAIRADEPVAAGLSRSVSVSCFIPAYLWPTDEYMAARFEEQKWPPELRRDAPYFVEGRCLFLRWKPDLSGFDFTSGGSMIADGGYTSAGTCGSDEPAVAYLDDRRWLAIVRTSTSHVDTFRKRNIIPQSHFGNCDPRYPLQIVELDANTLRLKRDTVTIIQDKGPDDDKWVRFSNFRAYDDRGSGDLIVLMTKSYCEYARAGLPTPAYRYRIKLPR